MRFRDFPLKNKLIITLALTIVLPLIIVSLIFFAWMSGNDKKSICESKINVLQRVQENMDRLFLEVEDTRDNLVVNGWLRKMLTGKAKTKDYVESNEWYVNVSRNRDYLVNFALSGDDKILFQRGWLLNSVNKHYTDLLSEKGVGQHLWTDTYEMDIVEIKGKGYEGMDRRVISNFYSISDGSGSPENMGVLSISVSESALSDMYQLYQEDSDENCFLINKDGEVLSAADKQEIGKNYGVYMDGDEMEKDAGYFQTVYEGKKVMAVYSRSSHNGWILLQIIPYRIFSASNRTAYGILLMAILFCIIFGLVFNRMQKKFIVHPLEALMEEMKKLQNGNFDIRLSNPSKDEIGVISGQFAEISKRLERLIEEAYLNKIYTQEAELQLLTSQINPHFLYNTLDSIHWEAIRNRDYNVADQLESLSEIFRHVLSKGKDMVTVEEEIHQVENYMTLMEKRYGNKVKFKKNVDVSLLSNKIPKLLLQPLVENALIHGLEPKAEDGYIQVDIRREGSGCFAIRVSDNGVGTDQEKIRKSLDEKGDVNDVFALKNINKRLILKYGENYGIQFRSAFGKGTEVTLTIPEDGQETLK